MLSKSLISSGFIVFLTFNSVANESNYLKLQTGQEAVGRDSNDDPIKAPKAVVSDNFNEVQNKLRTGNVLSGTDTRRNRTDEQYKLKQLQNQVIKSTSNVSEEQRLQQLDLGAEILPYIAPWINSIAEECMSAIKLDNRSATAQEAANCSAQAIKQYQDNPTAFLSRMPASERQQLEKIIKDKIAGSVNTNKNNPTGQIKP